MLSSGEHVIHSQYGIRLGGPRAHNNNSIHQFPVQEPAVAPNVCHIRPLLRMAHLGCLCWALLLFIKLIAGYVTFYIATISSTI